MTILCGTDFSPQALLACRAASALAKKTAEGLVVLVNVAEEAGGRSEHLSNLAQQLSAEFGVRVQAKQLQGAVSDALLTEADKSNARFIVLGVNGSAGHALGRVTERVAQTAKVPCFVIKNSHVEQWAAGSGVLRILVAVDFDAASKSALRWAMQFCESGAVEITLAHSAWPAHEHARLGVPMPAPLEGLHNEIEQILLRDLKTWAADVERHESLKYVVKGNWGRVDHHVNLMANELKADLLIVGTHRKSAIARLWRGSVSRGVLGLAQGSVVCVPPEIGAAASITAYAHVLIPTDFSALGNRAIAAGYGLVRPDGNVHLVHVISTELHAGDVTACEMRLRALIPLGAAARGIHTSIEIIKSENPGSAIAQAANALGVDAICMAMHTPSRTLELVMGSHVRAVLARAQVPVLLVTGERG